MAGPIVSPIFGGDGGGGGGGGALVIADDNFFADHAERDAYSVAAPDKLAVDLLIGVGATFQRWDGSAWQDVTAIVRGPAGATGPAGPAGPAGAAGAQGPAGADGPQGATGPAGADGIQGPAGPQGAGLIPDGYGDLTDALVASTEAAGVPFVYVVNPAGDLRADLNAPAALAGDQSLILIGWTPDNGWRAYGQFTGVQGPVGPAGAQGPTGPQGPQGVPGGDGPQGTQGPAGVDGALGLDGADGATGWSPLLAVEADGERRVQRVVGWTGGTGTEPDTLGYVGASGIVATAAEATDVRGRPGLVDGFWIGAPSQRVVSTLATEVSTTATALVNTGLEVTITPLDSGSIVRVDLTCLAGPYGSGTASEYRLSRIAITTTAGVVIKETWVGLWLPAAATVGQGAFIPMSLSCDVEGAVAGVQQTYQVRLCSFTAGTVSRLINQTSSAVLTATEIKQ